MTACCPAIGNHLIGRLETTPARRSTLPARYSPIRVASPAMTVIAGNSRRNTATRAGSRSSAMMRSGEHPARTRPCVRLPVPAPSSRIGPGRAKSMQRATASARRAPLGLAAAMHSGFCNQRAKKTPASAFTGLPLFDQAFILFYQWYVTVLCALDVASRSEDGHPLMVLGFHEVRGARHEAQETHAAAREASRLGDDSRS